MSKKKPWETHPHLWKSESAFMAFVRGGIRKSLWNRYPIKIEVMKEKRKRIPNPNPKGKVKEVWGGTCYLCGNDFPQKELQIDHIEGNHSLKSINEVQSFLEGMLFIDNDDLALVCKDCHSIKSYAERHGIDFEEARLRKAIIAFKKSNSVEKQKKVLADNNLPCKNSEERQESLKLYLGGK